jgi:hypothetical protein
VQGRHRITTPGQDRYLGILALRNRQCTANGIDIDFRQATGPILTVAYRRARLEFAQEHITWQLRHWRPGLFTDESRHRVSTLDRCEGVASPKRELFIKTLFHITGLAVGYLWCRQGYPLNGAMTFISFQEEV